MAVPTAENANAAHCQTLCRPIPFHSTIYIGVASVTLLAMAIQPEPRRPVYPCPFTRGCIGPPRSAASAPDFGSASAMWDVESRLSRPRGLDLVHRERSELRKQSPEVVEVLSGGRAL